MALASKALGSVLLLAQLTCFSTPLRGITVSGRVAESDTAPVARVTITVEQIGGELPPFITQTGLDGSWAVSDPLLTGNIRVTPSSSEFTFSPASRDAFTFTDLSSQDFTANPDPTVPRADISVLDGGAKVILTGGESTFAGIESRATLSRAFLLRNDGTLPLSAISVTIAAAPQGEFIVDRVPATSLAPNASTLLVVRIVPAGTGLRSATLLIHSDDPNENPFVVQLKCPVVSLDVTNTADSGLGSLRQAMLNTSITEAFDTIRFHPSLSGQTIKLSSEIPVTAIGTVVVDATTLQGGLTLSGGGSSRIFNAGQTTFKLLGLTLTGGRAQAGGAVFAQGDLFLSGCTFSNNISVSQGGAIASTGPFSTLILSNCTFLCNTGFAGGAVGSESRTFIDHSTFASNEANLGGALTVELDTRITRSTLTGNKAIGGSAIYFLQVLSLNHCTISSNFANGGGSLFSLGRGRAICNFSIVTGNFPDDQPIGLAGVVNQGSLLSGDPLLAPLDNYGGLTKTMALLPSSPARNAATNSTSQTDQRGFPMVGAPDIGAYEAGTFSDFKAFIWEHLPTNATVEQHEPQVDFDGDGADNLSEWFALTDPSDAASLFRIIRIALKSPTGVEVTFLSSAERQYQAETSENLIDWKPEGTVLRGTGEPMTVQVFFATRISRQFIRIRPTL